MKQWFICGLSTLALMLAACSANTEQKLPTIYEVNADVLTLKEKAEIKKQQKIEEQQAIHKAQLYNTLNEAVMNFGIARNDEATAGVLYANIVDFNNDGYEELYILLKNDNKPSPSVPHRVVAGYLYEIWTKNGEEKLASLSYSSIIPAFSDQEEFNVSLVRGEKNAFVSELKIAANETDTASSEKIVIVEKDASVATEKMFSKKNNETYINNALTPSADFVKARKAHSGQSQMILTSDLEAAKYTITTADIDVLLQKLESAAHKQYISK